MLDSLIFLPETSELPQSPLGRYLPPIAEGVVSKWLEEHIAPGAWILDPFGAAPNLAVEAARAGYRVLVTANNPITRFLLETIANPPTQSDLKMVLSGMAATRSADQRTEPYIQSLYATTCTGCGRSITAKTFIWDREANEPFAKIYRCPYCNDSGERPTTSEDVHLAIQIATQSALHRARAIERVAGMGDPERENVEEALSVYLPRSVLALFTLINKIDGIDLSRQEQRYLRILLLSACDQANTLWPYPAARARPKQLSVPRRFRENNVWMALEDAVASWNWPEKTCPCYIWSDDLGNVDPGSLVIYEGRLKDLASDLERLSVAAVLAPVPRPNQAFWTLSALWSGWLWGRDAVGPFRSVLRRRRYDWNWHESALRAVFSSLSDQLRPETPVFGLIGEAEPGFVSSALISAYYANFHLRGIALRQPPNQVQVVWNTGVGSKSSGLFTSSDGENAAVRAAIEYLHKRGEPSPYLPMHSAALVEIIQTGVLQSESIDFQTPQLVSQMQSLFQAYFSYRNGFVRFDGSSHSLDIGHWWLKEERNPEPPAADRLEVAIVNMLVRKRHCTYQEIEAEACKFLPGLFTPDTNLVKAILESYAEIVSADPQVWKLRQQDDHILRKQELQELPNLIAAMGQQLGYRVTSNHPILWEHMEHGSAYLFFIIATAKLGDIVFNPNYPPTKSVIVLPGSRSNLVMYKQQHDPRLEYALQRGWRFLKFRHLRSLAENPVLNQENFPELLNLDPLTYDAPQLHLL